MSWNIPNSKGLIVSAMRDVPPTEGSDRWAEPLVLRIQAVAPGVTPKLFLNSRSLSWEELNSSLKAELSQRSVWVVYVEADPNVSWQAALSAIDAARGLHAKVVLLTSRTETKSR